DALLLQFLGDVFMFREDELPLLIVADGRRVGDVLDALDEVLFHRLAQRIPAYDVREVVVSDIAGPRNADVVAEPELRIEDERLPLRCPCPWFVRDVMCLVGEDQGPRASALEAV